MNHLSLILFPVEAQLYRPDAASASLPHAIPVTYIACPYGKERLKAGVGLSLPVCMHVYVSVRRRGSSPGI